MKKLAAYAKALVELQKFNNLPFLIIICIGLNSWENAKKWQQRSEISAMVLTAGQNPKLMQWPVSKCHCVIDWNTGPSEELIIDMVGCLLNSGALSVTVRPLFVDLISPDEYYDVSKPLGQRWIQTRERIRTYHPGKEAIRDAA